VSVEADFGSSGILIKDRFIASSQINSLVDCVNARRERGDFSAGRIGASHALQRREDIRGDLTCWLREPLYSAERILLDQLEQLRLNLNRQAFLGLFDMEMHYAWYPPGAGYARHVDQPQGTSQRIVSLALYLNTQWESHAAGELRMFDTDDRFHDIEPIAGRLVCFLTTGREHAVLQTRCDRLSVSGWFRARD
jgi:SM-20-related protein